MNRDSSEVVRAAGILLISRNPHQFLLMRHRDRWDLPKGHCEPDETFLETALRETEEETGIFAEMIEIDPEFIFEVEYPVRYKRFGGQEFLKRVRYFLGHLASQPPLRITEHDSAEWFDWEPPHEIQSLTIDPLLAAVAEHFELDD